MSNQIKHSPTHRLLFASQRTNNRDHTTLSAPIQVGAVWGRKHGKQGGILKPDLSFGSLGQGAYFLRENKLHDQSMDQSAAPKTYRISFSEKSIDPKGAEKLGRPVEVAQVDQGGEIHWSIDPERLNSSNGAFFVLQNERTQSQTASNLEDRLTKVDSRKQQRSTITGRER